MKAMRFIKALARPLAAAMVIAPTAALAAQPHPWQLGFQPAGTGVMQDITDFHHLLLWVISLITLFVMGLMAYVMVRFSAKRNPTPTRTTHNTLVEVLWTAIPVIILVCIAVPSFKLLYKEDVIPKADMTVKAIGHQWYWSYEYPDNGNIKFDSLIVPTADLKPGQPRLLETDTAVMVPVNATVRMIITSEDVIHSWTIPAFGAKVDAVPGRLNDTWFKAEREGIYYGQCSELCGTNHGFMPIKVHVVSKEAFDAWVAEKKTADNDASPRRIADAAPAR